MIDDIPKKYLMERLPVPKTCKLVSGILLTNRESSKHSHQLS